jgi:hypothetical protein
MRSSFSLHKPAFDEIYFLVASARTVVYWTRGRHVSRIVGCFIAEKWKCVSCSWTRTSAGRSPGHLLKSGIVCPVWLTWWTSLMTWKLPYGNHSSSYRIPSFWRSLSIWQASLTCSSSHEAHRDVVCAVTNQNLELMKPTIQKVHSTVLVREAKERMSSA